MDAGSQIDTLGIVPGVVLQYINGIRPASWSWVQGFYFLLFFSGCLQHLDTSVDLHPPPSLPSINEVHARAHNGPRLLYYTVGISRMSQHRIYLDVLYTSLQLFTASQSAAVAGHSSTPLMRANPRERRPAYRATDVNQLLPYDFGVEWLVITDHRHVI